MLKNIKSRLDKLGVLIWYNSAITAIYFDKQDKIVHCQIGNKGVSARSIILGHGARLPKISSITGEFQVQESIHPRPAFHIVVKDDKKPKV